MNKGFEYPNGQWVARRYRYANGVCYNRNHFMVLFCDDGHMLGVGGALVVGGKALAYIGMPGEGNSVKRIMAHTKAFVWGDSLTDALKKLKATYPDPFAVDRERGTNKSRKTR
jgi:hypothetical protein